MSDPIPMFPARTPSAPAARGVRWSRMEALVHAIDGIVWEADPATLRFTFVSNQAERILGHPADAWRQAGFWSAHLHPADRQRTLNQCLEQTAAGVDHVAEFRMRTPDGRDVWLRNSVSVEMRAGTPVGLRGIMIDITALKKTQRALAEQFHFIWQLADAIPCPIFWKDSDGRYGGCNTAFEAYVGIDRESLLGKTVYDIAPPDLARVYEAADRELLDSRRTQVYEAQVRYADGSRHNAMFYKATFSLKDGELGGLVGVMLDITDRKQLEAVVSQKSSLLETILDTMPDGISVVDAELRVTLTNAKARRIMALPDEMFASGAIDLETVFRYNARRGEYGPGDPDEQVAFRIERARQFRPHRFERTRPDGTVIEIRGEPLSAGGFVTIYRDVTDARRAQQELARHSASLNAVIEHLPQGVSVFDEALRLKHWNRGLLDVLDLPDELVSADVLFDDLIRVPASRGEYGPGDPETHVRRIHDLALQFQPHQFERTRPNGKSHLVCGRPLLIDGVVRGFITTYTDISERRRVEEALRLSSTVFERAAEGIMLTDANGRIVRVNDAFRKITGYSAEEVLGQSPRMLASGLQGPDFYAIMWRHLNERGNWNGEIINRRKSGLLYTEHLSITRVTDGGGTVTGYIGIFTDITEVRDAARQIERLSYFDALTGLPNRALLLQRLDAAVRRARADERALAVLTIDVDRLSHINDTLGHHYGDKLLLAVAQRLAATIDLRDSISRHAGDGYALIVEDVVRENDLRGLAERLLEAICQPFQLDQHPISINAHIGIAIYPGDGGDPATLLKHADAALHHVKSEGLDRYEFFRAEMNAAGMERLLIETRLRQALDKHEFLLHFQPQVDFATGAITGMEALVRWQHPEMGLVSPAKFIPIAESTGQIVHLGCWVLREACRATQALREAGHRDLKIAVNVSAMQFNQDDFSERVQRALALSGLPPENLELELTESLILQRPDHVIRTMSELKKTGITFAIDDFGTGYSSLSLLKRFPIDKLKIDQSFVRDITSTVDDEGAAITQAIIALGRGLKLNVIAEGVETAAQKAFLVAGGCHAMQGYLFSRPLPLEELTALLAVHRPHPCPSPNGHSPRP